MIIASDERKSAKALSELSYCNPFTPERIELERGALGDDFVWTDDAWHRREEVDGVPPNIDLLTDYAERMSEGIRERLTAGHSASTEEIQIYQDVVFYFVYNRFQETLWHLICGTLPGCNTVRCHAPFFKEFRATLEYYFAVPTPELWRELDVVHLFACFYQLRRGFHFVHGNILGSSMLSARLRASVWESIFTHDTQRYRRSLYNRMGDIATLVTGPSGTGKELVAQAIAYARYIPFSEKRAEFTEDYRELFFPLNLAALSPTLIESELFGHKKGAFTGALQDRRGRFEVCSSLGTVFLDEIGEVDQSIQVKLLRVLQTREFQPVGDIEHLAFRGKIVAATNRDLSQEMEKGTFREDLYYRLCSDIIVTPSLREQIRESSEQLHSLLLFIAKRLAGEEDAENLAQETQSFIRTELDPDYRWPGNVRELEQCVRNILIRKRYDPPKPTAQAPHVGLVDAIKAGAYSADELITHYVSLVYAQTGNYQETGRRLKLDGRTVKTKVDPRLVEMYSK